MDGGRGPEGGRDCRRTGRRARLGPAAGATAMGPHGRRPACGRDSHGADGRTEPDVIALWPDLLAFVEAKHGSTNDSQPGYAGYATYLPASGLFAASDDQVRAEGSYQLTRNWVIGAALAEELDVPFRLVNL